MLYIDSIKNTIAPICKEYGVKRAYLFGSYARGEANESSDIDIRIEKGKNDLMDSLIKSSSFRLKLEEALKRKVDVITNLPTQELYAIFVKNVQQDEVLIYEA